MGAILKHMTPKGGNACKDTLTLQLFNCPLFCKKYIFILEMSFLTSFYDSMYRFDPSKFDAIFSKFARTQPNALTEDEISTMLKDNRNMYDFVGW
jgi:hypothetical protein